MQILLLSSTTGRYLVVLQNVLCLGQLLLGILSLPFDASVDLLVGDELLDL